MKKIVLFLLIFCPIALFSQTWTKEYPNDSLGKSCYDVVGFANEFVFGITQAQYAFYGFNFTQGFGTKIYKASIADATVIDSSIFYNKSCFNYIPVNDSMMYYIQGTNSNREIHLANNLQTSHIFYLPTNFIGKLSKKNKIISFFGHFSNFDCRLYRLDSALNLIDSTDIQHAKFLINSNNFTPEGIGNLYYNERTKKYWFSSFFRQVVLDSSLTPIEVWAFQTYDDIQSGFSSMTSPTQIEMPSGSIYAVSSAKRTITLSGPPWGLTKHLIRVTKWNENYQIEDSLEFSYFPNQDTQYVISDKSISWKNNPNEIYVCASTSAYDPLTTQVIVAKIDSSLNIHWVKSFRHPTKGFTAYGIEALEEGGAIIYGSANSGTDSLSFNHSGYLIRIDSTGAILTTNDPLMRVEKDFIVYPNPAKNDLYFSAQHSSKPIDIELYDALGALVYQEKNVKQTRLSLEGWSTGIYTYRVRCEARISTGKFVKE